MNCTLLVVQEIIRLILNLIKIYKKATALEALFGMLYIKKDINRIKEIIKYIVGE